MAAAGEPVPQYWTDLGPGEPVGAWATRMAALYQMTRLGIRPAQDEPAEGG